MFENYQIKIIPCSVYSFFTIQERYEGLDVHWLILIYYLSIIEVKPLFKKTC